LERDVAIFPVLLDGAAMPREDRLPIAVRELSRRQAHPLSHDHWRRDADLLLTALPPEVRRRGARARWRGAWARG
jgi:hypothetical protein